MADKRQVYRVILQIMTYIGIAVFLWVMFASVFVPDNEKSSQPLEVMEISLKNLAKGKITHVMWQGKKVSILYRNHQQNKPTKSGRYLIYYDVGDSGNCPLYFTGEILKDTCTGTQYNQLGEPIKRLRANDLESPLYYFLNQTTLILGRDNPK